MVEMAISLAALVIVLGAIGMISQRVEEAAHANDVRNDLGSACSRSLDRIWDELFESGVEDLTPPPLAPLGSADLTYRPCAGWVGGAIAWQEPARFLLELEDGETDDGVDEDGDGLVDERRLVWIRNEGLPDEDRTVLAHDVREFLAGEVPNGMDDNGNGLIDERGLSFELDGEVLTVRLTLERMDRGGRRVVVTRETAILVRN
jgi:hypothetical protein